MSPLIPANVPNADKPAQLIVADERTTTMTNLL